MRENGALSKSCLTFSPSKTTSFLVSGSRQEVEEEEMVKEEEEEEEGDEELPITAPVQ